MCSLRFIQIFKVTTFISCVFPIFATIKNKPLELSGIIAKLLETNNFVSLPGIGSFVQTYQSAKLSDDGKTFLPPGQHVLFDTNRTFNDEAIERFLSEHEAKSPFEAKELTEAFVRDTKAKLDSNGEYFFSGIGSLKMVGGAISFTQCSEDELISSTFGLKPIAISPKLTDKVAQQKETKKSVPTSPSAPKKRGILIPVAIGAFVVISCALLYLLVPSVRFWEKKSTSLAIKAPDKKQNVVTIEPNNLEQPADSTSLKEAIVTDKKQALYYQEAIQPEANMYYIISGSFSSHENAQKYFNSLVEKGFKPEILEANGIFRVAKSRYSNRNRALKELERMRNEKPNESVWLLGL
jgi:hypothetical protein